MEQENDHPYQGDSKQSNDGAASFGYCFGRPPWTLGAMEMTGGQEGQVEFGKMRRFG
jgi:hypothetical protein